VPVQFETWTSLPRYEVVGYAIALVEVLGGVMVLIGFQARFAACLLFLFAFGMLFVTFDLLTLDGLMRAVQRQALMHLSVMGALMLIAAAGAGPWSFDGRSRGG
jgi:putative oxidoreductase